MKILYPFLLFKKSIPTVILTTPKHPREQGSTMSHFSTSWLSSYHKSLPSFPFASFYLTCRIIFCSQIKYHNSSNTSVFGDSDSSSPTPSSALSLPNVPEFEHWTKLMADLSVANLSHPLPCFLPH